MPPPTRLRRATSPRGGDSQVSPAGGGGSPKGGRRGNDVEGHTRGSLANARKQRRAMSLPEGLLWRHLRQRPLGMKFRNHHPIGNLVVDFYCASRRLVIEIDGISHDMGDNPQRDLRRDGWLRSQGFEVVRIAAAEVLRDPAGVAESLGQLCASPPPSALRAATSPRGGASYTAAESPPLGEVGRRRRLGGGALGAT
ncbi:MAG: endonuclease domain-containing protein [Tsuneonella sp.]